MNFVKAVKGQNKESRCFSVVSKPKADVAITGRYKSKSYLFRSVIDIFGFVSTTVASVFITESTVVVTVVVASAAAVETKWLVFLKFSTAFRSDLLGMMLSGDVFSLQEWQEKSLSIR